MSAVPVIPAQSPGQSAPRAASIGRRVYDVAVIGPHTGGAAAAALIARRGLRVLLAPLSTPLLARESEGWLLPTAHPLLPPLRQLTGAAAAIDELGLGQELHRQTLAPGPFQLLGDKLRLSLPAEPARRRSEFRRELPEAEAQQAEAELESLDVLGRAWDPFLAALPPYPARGFFERRKLHKLLPVPPEMPTGLVGEALAAVAPFAAFLVGDTAPEATAREAAALLRAPLRLWGGPAQVGELCRRKAVEAGAQLFPDACSALRLEKKGVTFVLGGSEVRASAVVLACDAEMVAQLCEGGGRQERSLADEAGELRAAHKLVLAHFVVRPEGLPLALEDTALILGQAGPLLMSSQPARKGRGETAGERLLTVARVAPKGESDGPALLALVRSALEPVLPFFERHVLHQSADMDPAASHPLFAPSEDGEPLGLRPISRTHERVLFASAGAYPGFGLEGSLVAARACAAHAHELSGRRSVQAT
jgi:hypothetical protein